jgi:ferredoxin
MSKKIATIGPNCVACGVCATACPIGAIRIDRGLRAVVDAGRCVGCARCERACPAGIIAITERQEVHA